MHIITQTHDSRFLGSWDPGSLKIECRNVKFLFQNLRYFVAKVFFVRDALLLLKSITLTIHQLLTFLKRI